MRNLRSHVAAFGRQPGRVAEVVGRLYAAAQKSCFEDIMSASMEMVEVLLKEYGIEDDDVEDLRNMVLELADESEAILK